MKAVCITVMVLLCHSSLITAQTPTDGGVRPVEDDDGGRCEALTNPFCTHLNYTSSYLPNFRNHESAANAGAELFTYVPLINSECSDYLQQLLCAYYFPLCYMTNSNNVAMRLKPCKSLCEVARSNCSQVLSENSEYEWPEFLNCSLETFTCDKCFGPPDLSTSPECVEPITTTEQETTIYQSSSMVSSFNGSYAVVYA